MSDEYPRMFRSVLSVLAEIDPLELADPDISLTDEYEAEAREIARRILGASGGAADRQALIQDVFVQRFDARISGDALAAIARATV